MKIALVGDAISTRELAPFADPSWEIWAAGNGYTHLKRCTRYFELHGLADVSATIKADLTLTTYGGITTDFWNAPAKLGCTHVYTGKEIPDKFVRREDGPVVAEFPFDAVLGDSRFPFPIYTSTFAWLIAFAITQQPEAIALYGFDLSLDEYVTQKEAIAHFLGIAVGMGITVTVAPRSFMLRSPFLYAIETSANRASRSFLMDQRYIIEKELAKRQTTMDQAFYARIVAIARLDEHKQGCSCTPEAPCARRAAILKEAGAAITAETQANIEVGQLKNRLDENTYCLRHMVITDDFGPDGEKEDKGLPMLAVPDLSEYHGAGYAYPLPKEVVANIRPNGTIDYEIADTGWAAVVGDLR